jgi:hypothetical protein
MEDKEILLCPVCKTPLKITHWERYQDLSEHVSDPNGVPSLKPGYQCENIEWCVANKYNAAWIEDGDFFMRDVEGREISTWDAREIIEKSSLSGHLFALNSFHHFIEVGKKEIKKLTRSISVGKYKIVFQPREKGWDYPENQRHMPNMWRWKVEYWEKTSEYGYTSIIPTSRMTKFLVDEFNRYFKRVVKDQSESDILKCMEIIYCRSRWGSKSDKVYSKIASFLIRIFHPIKRSIIIDLAKEKGISLKAE